MRGLDVSDRAAFLTPVRSGHRSVAVEHHCRVLRLRLLRLLLLLLRVVLLMVRGLLHVCRGGGAMVLRQRWPEYQMLLRWLLLLLLLLLLLTRRFFVVVVTQ